jgi:hypothetical protein
MTQRQIFFIFIMRSKGCERKGGSTMIASEFGDRSPAQQNGANDHKFQAVCPACADGLFARSASRGHSESVT